MIKMKPWVGADWVEFSDKKEGSGIDLLWEIKRVLKLLPGTTIELKFECEPCEKFFNEDGVTKCEKCGKVIEITSWRER